MRRKPDRVIGRYDEAGRPDPRGRRVIYVRGGQRSSETFSTSREAGDFSRRLQAEIEGSATLTIAGAIELYLDDLRRAGMAPLTLRHRPQILLRFFKDGEDPVNSLTPKRITAFYRAQVDSGCAAATHHLLLRCAKAFCTWASGRRNRYGVTGASPPLLPVDPSEGIHPEGRAKQGKNQPRVDEAVRLIVACDRLALERRDPAAIAVLALVYTGARLGEITTRQARDLDADATILWMPPSSRTKKRPPYREVHEPLRSHLRALADGKAPTDPLFPCGPHENHSGWLGRHLTRLCSAAGIPRVAPQALRGLHESLAIKKGVAAREVAAEMGHHINVARRAYHAPGVEQEAQAAAVQAFLNRSWSALPPPSPDGDKNNS